MIGIGYLEIIVALVVMLVVLGPERMPVVVRSIARFVREIRAVASEARAQLNDVLPVDELRTLADDTKKQMREVTKEGDINGVVRNALTQDPADGTIGGSIAPVNPDPSEKSEQQDEV